MDNVHEDMKNIKQILTETHQSATLRSSDTVVQQIPLKLGVFHGRDDILEEITQWFMKEETLASCDHSAVQWVHHPSNYYDVSLLKGPV